MINKNKKYFISTVLFFSIFLIMGIPYFKWGFNSGDDFGNIWHCKCSGIKDFFKFFYEGGAQHLSQPDNHKIPVQQSFLNVFYRPLSFIFYYLQSLICNFSAYGFYLFTIAIHALNTTLLFNLFWYFAGFYLSIFLALLFAFHPSLARWIGWISAQPYQLVLLFFLLALLSLKKYLNSKKLFYYLVSIFLFMMILFTHEQLVLFPFWLIGALFFYEKFANANVRFFVNIKKYIKLSSGYFLVAGFYLFVRNYFFPLIICHPELVSGSSSTFLVGDFSIKYFLAKRVELFFDYITCAVDFLGGTFLKGSGYLPNGLFIFVWGVIILFLFLKNRRKSYMLFFLFSIFIFSWNVFLIHYQPRYIYVSLPFFILILLFGIRFYSGNYFKLRKLTLLILVSLVVFNVFYNSFWLSKREWARDKLRQSYKLFISNHELQNKTFCFVGIPISFYQGSAQAVRIYSKNKNIIVYSEKCFATHFKICHLDNCFENMPDNGDLQITFQNKKLNLKSLNCDKVWFGQEIGKIKKIEIEHCMGKQKILKIIDDKICEFDFIFKKEFFDQNMTFVTWDYDKLAFKILGERYEK